MNNNFHDIIAYAHFHNLTVTTRAGLATEIRLADFSILVVGVTRITHITDKGRTFVTVDQAEDLIWSGQ